MKAAGCGGTRHDFPGGPGQSPHRDLHRFAGRARALRAGDRIQLDGLISHRLPLGRPGEGVEPMRRHEAVKGYVVP